MFDKIEPHEAETILPLHQDNEGIEGFRQYYWWAVRDEKFSITEQNLPQILQFIDKFDVPLLAREVISWTKSPANQKTEFELKMIFNCLRCSFMKEELSYWYKSIAEPTKKAKIVALLGSPELAKEVGNQAIMKLILGLVHVLENCRLEDDRDFNLCRQRGCILENIHYCGRRGQGPSAKSSAFKEEDAFFR